MERNIFDDLAARNNTAQVPDSQEHIEHVDPNQQLYPEQEPVSTEPEPEVEVQAKPTPQQSFQEMRLRTEQLQKERDEAVRVLRQVEEYAIQQQQQQQQYQQPMQQAPEQSSPDYDDDDIVEGRHLKNEISAIKRQFDTYRQQQEQFVAAQKAQSIELQLKAKHNDFDKVMTYENIAKLRELRPEIAQTLHQSNDIYNKASSTYTLLKELGIYHEDVVNPDMMRAQANSLKPKPVASVSPQRGDSPLSHANAFSGDLSDIEKRKIYSQMVSNSKRR